MLQSQKSLECLLHWKFKCWGVMLCHRHVAFNIWRNVLPSYSSSSTLLRLHDLKHKVIVILHPLTLCHIPELYLQQHHCETLKLHSSLLAEYARTSQLTVTNISIIYFSDHELNTRFIQTKSWSSPALFRNKLLFATVPTAALQQNVLADTATSDCMLWLLPTKVQTFRVQPFCRSIILVSWALSFLKLTHTVE